MSGRSNGGKEMRAGDTVKHGPTGETWVLACVKGDMVAWCGWPPGQAYLKDCELVEACSDAGHRMMLETWAEKNCTGNTDWRTFECSDQLRKLDEAKSVE
jgi:hypothetical protein